MIRETVSRSLAIECIDPSVMLFSGAFGQYELEEMRFIAQRKLLTSAELKEYGLTDDEISSITDAGNDNWTPLRAREGIYQDASNSDSMAIQDSERLRECYDCWLRLDMHQDGSSQLMHILFGGGIIIVKEEADYIPFATGSPVPLPHRIQGTGLYELVYQIQDAKTDLMRKFIDGIEAAILNRVTAVEGQTNLNDLTDGRINGVVRVRSPDAVTPLITNPNSQEARGALAYLDTVREQRSGASVELNESDRQLMGSSAMAAAGGMEQKEKMSAWYCRNLVNSLLKSTYLLVHRTLRTQWNAPLSVNIRGKWQQVNPQEWAERSCVEVVAGLTSSEKQK